jgi:hypothetical protein
MNPQSTPTQDRRRAPERDAPMAVFSVAVDTPEPVDSVALNTAVLNQLRAAVRWSDFIGDYASQGFAVLCHQIRDHHTVYGVASRIEASLGWLQRAVDNTVPVRVSLGIGVVPAGKPWDWVRSDVDAVRAFNLAWTEGADGLSAAVRKVSVGEPAVALLRSPDPELLGDVADILGRHAPPTARRLVPVGGDGVVAILEEGTVADALWLADGVRAAATRHTGGSIVAGAARVAQDGQLRMLAVSEDHLGADLAMTSVA